MARLVSFGTVFALTLITVVGISALLALPVGGLWGFLFTTPESIIGVTLPALDFWQAWALLILVGIGSVSFR